MSQFSLYPRLVAFEDNKAVVEGNPAHFYKDKRVISLPSDHYDFAGPIRVEGKTQEQIDQEVSEFMESHQ